MNVKNESVTHRSTFFLFVRCLIILGLLNNALITFDKSEILLLLPFPYYNINNLRSALGKKVVDYLNMSYLHQNCYVDRIINILSKNVSILRYLVQFIFVITSTKYDSH